MSSVRYELETVTATFLHGAHKESAELRAHAFKSLARYWFRAALGAVCPDPGELREEEGRIFGAAGTGRGVSLRLRLSTKPTVRSERLLPHQAGGAPIGAVRSGTAFELLLSPSRRFDAQDVIVRAASALWLGLHLGGVGQRSRRGAGSVAAMAIEGAAPGALRASSLEEYADELRRGIRTSVDAIRGGRAPAPGGAHRIAEFPMLDGAARIQVVPLSATTEEAARAELMLGLRPHKNPVFGLPYLKPKVGEQKRNGRHASPLWIRVIRIGDTYAMVQTAVRSRTLPDLRDGSWEAMVAYLDSFSARQPVPI